MDMEAIKKLPRLIVDASIDGGWPFVDNKFTNIVNFTVESMYNIPNIMSNEMDYDVCTFLPSVEPVMQNCLLVIESNFLQILDNECRYFVERQSYRDKRNGFCEILGGFAEIKRSTNCY